MVEAKFRENCEEVEVKIIGHTDPLICSAISAITYTMLGSLQNFKERYGWCVEFQDKEGDMVCHVSGVSFHNDVISTILATWWIGLKQIEAKHPENITVMEV